MNQLSWGICGVSTVHTGRERSKRILEWQWSFKWEEDLGFSTKDLCLKDSWGSDSPPGRCLPSITSHVTFTFDRTQFTKNLLSGILHPLQSGFSYYFSSCSYPVWVTWAFCGASWVVTLWDALYTGYLGPLLKLGPNSCVSQKIRRHGVVFSHTRSVESVLPTGHTWKTKGLG